MANMNEEDIPMVNDDDIGDLNEDPPELEEEEDEPMADAKQEKKKKGTYQSRHWVLTAFPEDQEHPEQWIEERKAILSDSEKIRYFIGGIETAPETGTKHIQGYIELATMANKWSMKKMKTFLGDNMLHLEGRRGTRQQARDYCLKEDKNAVQIGKWIKGAGARTDLEQLADSVKEGKSTEWIANEMPGQYIRYYKGIQALKNAINPPKKRDNIQCTCLYGKPGSGKTTRAIEFCEKAARENNARAYWKSMGPWWEGYDGEEIIVFDDFDGTDDWYPYSKLLKLLSKAPDREDIKGSSAPMNATIFLFTSNKHPREWYQGKSYNVNQLAWRFSTPGSSIRKLVIVDDDDDELLTWPKEKVVRVNKERLND